MTDISPQHIAAAVACVGIAWACILFLAYGKRECVCPACAQHVREREEAAKRQRALDHRATHDYWRAAPWGDPRCNRCKDGGDKDQFVR